LLRFLIRVFITVWLAFLTAAAIEIHRPASLDGVAGIDSTGKPPTAELLDRIEQAIWRRNAPLELSEADVNRYLAASLIGKQGYPSALLAQFERVAVSFQPGMCRVWLCWIEGQRRVTASLDFTVKRIDRNFVVEPKGGSLGRLPVFRGALATLVPGLRSLCAALDEEIHATFQMNQIRFEKDKVVLDPRFAAKKS
jgi:hypothetical protein